MALPGPVVKVLPFIVSGWLTGRLVTVSGRGPKLIASVVLAVVSAVAWTTFSIITRSGSLQVALTLLAASVPVFLIAAAWAYLGLYLGDRMKTTTGRAIDPELDPLERELRDEMARRRGEDPSANPSSPENEPSRGHGEDTTQP